MHLTTLLRGFLLRVLGQPADAASQGRMVSWRDMEFGNVAVLRSRAFAYLIVTNFFFLHPIFIPTTTHVRSFSFSFPSPLQKMDDLFDGAIGIDLGTTYS